MEPTTTVATAAATAAAVAAVGAAAGAGQSWANGRPAKSKEERQEQALYFILAMIEVSIVRT